MRKIILWSLCAASALGLAACTSATVTAGKASSPTSSAKTPRSAGGATTTTAPAHAMNSLGTTVTIPDTVGGIDKVTVAGWYPGVTDTGPLQLTPPAGHTWDAIDATTCAGPKGASTGPDSSDFTVLLNNGSTASTSVSAGGAQFGGPLSTLSNLGESTAGLSPGQCVRGYVVFSVPVGTVPTAVQFSGTSASFTAPNSVVKWAIPAG